MRTILVIVNSLIVSTAAASGQPCDPLTADREATLIRYVKGKFALPNALPVRVSQTSTLNGSCFRRLLFASENPDRPFALALIASPDFRFLMREVFDSQSDPYEEVKQRRSGIRKILDLDEPSASAAVTLTIFSDFQCPYCAQMARWIHDNADGAHGVRVVFRHFPLPMHRLARAAAEAAACAGMQDAKYFWSVHDYLFSHQQELKEETFREMLLAHARTLGDLKLTEFRSCLDEHKAAKRIDTDIALANQLGVTATPTLFINDEQVVGFRPERFQALLEPNR